MDYEPAALQLSMDDRRLLGGWTADCAERVLPLFEAQAPADARPREAIEGIRIFARDGKRTVQLRSVALAAAHHAKHALGPAVYAALARELAAADGPGMGDAEIRWAIDHASPAVREIVGRWPARVMGRTRLNALYYQLDSGLRREREFRQD